MRGTRGGSIRKPEPRPVLTGNDLFVALPFILFALYVYRGGLDEWMGNASSAALSEAQLAADAAAYRQLLDQQQLLQAQQVQVVQQQPQVVAPAAVPAAPAAPAPPAVVVAPAPAPAAAAAPAAKKQDQGRARPSPPSRPVLDAKAAPSLPPLGKDDPAMPDTPLGQFTFIDGGKVNAYRHELAERSGLKTIEERDWWPTVEKGWERDVRTSAPSPHPATA